MPMDAWDGNTDKMSAQDFLWAFHRDVKVSTSSADKAKAFKNYLATNSDADDWFQALPAATKLDMDLIDIANEAQYPAEPKVQPTATEFGTELLRCKLTKEELGTKVKVADRKVWAHYAWGTKMQRLVLKAGVSATTMYIEQVRVELLGPLCMKIGKTHVNWPAFIKAVRDVNTVELELNMKEEKERWEEFSKMRQVLQVSPTAGIRAQLTNARLGLPVQAPTRWPTPAPERTHSRAQGAGAKAISSPPHECRNSSRHHAPRISPKHRTPHTSPRCSSPWTRRSAAF
ncbi:hypothetical protein FB451DRAFT_1403685 [Mycena latifolia]|nr:hypothetical protein FB451DRAFT_1403685 [Mycena latifolia]